MHFQCTVLSDCVPVRVLPPSEGSGHPETGEFSGTQPASERENQGNHLIEGKAKYYLYASTPQASQAEGYFTPSLTESRQAATVICHLITSLPHSISGPRGSQFFGFAARQRGIHVMACAGREGGLPLLTQTANLRLRGCRDSGIQRLAYDSTTTTVTGCSTSYHRSYLEENTRRRKKGVWGNGGV